MTCPECGGEDRGVPCAGRWSRLLALDHSRTEPWGSRHALAFSVYHLQHPELKPDVLERCWAIAWAVCRSGMELARVTRAIRRYGQGAAVEWGVPALPEPPPSGGPYAVTLPDLGDFDESTYPDRLLSWAAATVDRWSPV